MIGITMIMRVSWTLCVITVALSLFDLSRTEVNEDTNASFLSYADIRERQKLEFVDALGYEQLTAEHLQEVDYFAAGKDDSKEKQAKPDRDRRAVRRDIYAGIAGSSGGSVIAIDKTNLTSALGVITSSTLSSPVLIMRTTMDSKGSDKLTKFSVDSSVTVLDLQIQTTCCKANVTIFDPSSHPVTPSSPNVTVLTDTRTLYGVQITSPVMGQWHLSVYDVNHQIYNVLVRGSSLVNFGVTYSDSHGTDSMELPVPNSNATYVKVAPVGYDLVRNWTNFITMAMNGTVLHRVPLTNLRGSHSYRAFLIPVIWPDQDVYIGVEGIDKSGLQFTRIQPSVVTPVGLRIYLNNPGLEFISTCNPINIPFTVLNVGNPSSLNFSAFSTNIKFTVSVSPSRLTLGEKRSAHVNVTLMLKENSVGSGETVTVTLLANAPDGRSQHGDIDLFTKAVTCQSVSTVQYETTSHSSQSTSVGFGSETYNKIQAIVLVTTLTLLQVFT